MFHRAWTVNTRLFHTDVVTPPPPPLTPQKGITLNAHEHTFHSDDDEDDD